MARICHRKLPPKFEIEAIKISNIQYIKTLKKQITSNGQASKKLFKYKYEDQFQERPTISNNESSDFEEDNKYEVPNTYVSANNIINTSDIEQSLDTFNATCVYANTTAKKGQRNSIINVDEVLLLLNMKTSENTSQKDPINAFLMGIEILEILDNITVYVYKMIDVIIVTHKLSSIKSINCFDFVQNSTYDESSFMSSAITLVLKCHCVFGKQKTKSTMTSLWIKENLHNSHLIIFMIEKNLKN
ncbi:hypothetical protein AGLY_006074 [Aphis glycines]|uniref:Uncharacterized protein n=1 Tax=Aphis glycines TaxID=307491 RepID=A0A6G0TV15_APHGL|nr:hypothetical protein AGLY_006074 [Aphis glycines]